MKTATQLGLFNVSEVSLIYRNRIPVSDRKKICSSTDAYDILIANWDPGTIEHREEFKILLLNRSNTVLGIFPLSAGGISGTVIDCRMIFQAALKCNASGIILSHNHPSGNLNPSEADKHITRKIKDAGVILDISVLDHIILTSSSFYSFCDDGNI